MALTKTEALVMIAQAVLRHAGADEKGASPSGISTTVYRCKDLIKANPEEMKNAIAELNRYYGH